MRRGATVLAVSVALALGLWLAPGREAAAQCPEGWELVGETEDEYLCSPIEDADEVGKKIPLGQPGVTLEGWGGRMYRLICETQEDCVWLRVTDSSQFGSNDEVRIFPGGYLDITLPNGQAVRYDPKAQGSREIVVNLGVIYDEDLYSWEQDVSSSDQPEDGSEAPRQSSPPPAVRMNLYVDPESLGLEAEAFTGPRRKVYIPLASYEDRGPDDRAGVCKCSAPLIEEGQQ